MSSENSKTLYIVLRIASTAVYSNINNYTQKKNLVETTSCFVYQLTYFLYIYITTLQSGLLT